MLSHLPVTRTVADVIWSIVGAVRDPLEWFLGELENMDGVVKEERERIGL